MTQARAGLVALSKVLYYHVISRCVRSAWLCGKDAHSGKDYSHRMAWMYERLKLQAGVFTIDVCAYALMNHHYHLVLHIDRAAAQRLSSAQVIERWSKLFKRPPVLERWQRGICNPEEQEDAERLIADWRNRLADVSWFMRCLNEHFARRANREDQSTGRFWEGRFQLQALLDEVGLLTAMAFVDLNPVRGDAPLGDSWALDSLMRTSLRQRIAEIKPAASGIARGGGESVPLQVMGGGEKASLEHAVIPFCMSEYWELLRWTRMHMRSAVQLAEDDWPRILRRLRIERTEWARVMVGSSATLGRAMGRTSQLRRCAATLGQSWIRGMRRAQKLYNR